MKSLHGLRKEQLEKLREMGYINPDIIVSSDGISEIDGEPLHVVFFDTSEEKDKAYNVIFEG